MPVVKDKQERNLALARSSFFDTAIGLEIEHLLKKAEKKGKNMAIRIHDSGDFFSKTYARQWLFLANKYPQVDFYGYTKEVKMWEGMPHRPANFRLVYSLGGKHDDIIDREKHRHSRVFGSLKDLKRAGYVDASKDDSVAFLAKNNKIGLIHFGPRAFNNTKWEQ
jgi:hypothetical protein